MLGGRERTVEQYETLLAETGFALHSVAPTYVDVELRDPGSDPGGQSRPVGNVTVHDTGLVDHVDTTGCQTWITGTAEQPTVTITSYIHSDEVVSLCTFTSVALNSALEKYETGDIGYDPDHIAQHSFADVSSGRSGQARSEIDSIGPGRSAANASSAAAVARSADVRTSAISAARPASSSCRESSSIRM